jgi:hypothetical protein
MITIPHTARIFEKLSKGDFICSNSSDRDERDLFETIDDATNYELLKDYFGKINFQLEKGNEYYYFSRMNEGKADIERKLHTMLTWIDIYDFFKSNDISFGSGAQLQPVDIANKINVNALLKNKLEALRLTLKLDEKMSAYQIILAALKELAKYGYASEVSLLDNTYKIHSSIHYLENMLNNIIINKDVEDAIPE